MCVFVCVPHSIRTFFLIHNQLTSRQASKPGLCGCKSSLPKLGGNVIVLG